MISGGTLEFRSAFSQDVTFNSQGTLELAQSREFTANVTGFSKRGKTTLDLDDIAFVGTGEATFSGTKKGGVLTIADGAHTARIQLEGNYLGEDFVAASDGNGGTDILAEKPGISTVPPHSLISAMAALGAPPPASTRGHFGEGERLRGPLIALPRISLA